MIKDHREYESGEKVDEDFTAIKNVVEKGENEKHSLKSTPKEYEIADICFGKGRIGEMSHYIKLTTLRNNYIKNLREVQDKKMEE